MFVAPARTRPMATCLLRQIRCASTTTTNTGRPFSSQQLQHVAPPSAAGYPNEHLYTEENFTALKVAHEAWLMRQQAAAVDDEEVIGSAAPANIAREMNMAEAAMMLPNPDVDKILILVRHGEAGHNVFERDYMASGRTGVAGFDKECPQDPLLSSKGMGQVLNLSRTVDTYCNSHTQFFPELFVVSPLRRATQTALMAFPRYAPGHTLRNTKWICNKDVSERSNGYYSDISAPPQALADEFPGIDYSLYRDTYDPVNDVTGPLELEETKHDLVKKTGKFLSWVKEREERVIVVSSHSYWLQAFNDCALNFEDGGAIQGAPYKNGEMRAVALKWT
mmetsp:Transcript_27062/g.41989  ORF Transcript_27062/g.41989 Transcript_27062/m.41989 type:complete len:335 (+) Transcript_27062:131-1135(+)|eukprot:CAMPEP_0196815420 /NCGR_PEP_ID=MMETSP1362-20130617/49656_1 /TAXON_ID=163516 /ORGANISM="Leptocylindrus danicus, Strain CCMP1856" /LENGTH=334 /DNA_ID=CAMNT_0042192367 /DNA_START=127 /DNA_END=1131 /DNA_ORIENTATION=-